MPPAVVAGDQAERAADDQPEADRAEPDHHRVPGALREVQQHVVAVAVEAERVARDLEEALARVTGQRVVGRVGVEDDRDEDRRPGSRWPAR